MDTVGKIFGIKKPDTSASDAAIAAANQAATLERSQADATGEIAQQRAQLTLGAPGKRGLLAYLDPSKLSDTLG